MVKGRAVVKLPKKVRTRPGSYRVTVVYGGSRDVQRSTAKVTLRVR